MQVAHKKCVMLAYAALDSDLEQAKELVAKHRVRWAVYPEYGPNEANQQQQVGFVVELLGTHDHPKREPQPGCSECYEVFQDLRVVAEAVLPRIRRQSRIEISPFDRRIAFDARHRMQKNVIAKITVTHWGDYGRPIDECERSCVEEIRQRLILTGAKSDPSL